MSEVRNQLEPFSVRLTKTENWQHKLWSNGSNGPPGYLETARDEDKQRQKEVDEKIEIIMNLLDPRRRFNQWIKILSLVVAAGALIVAIWTLYEHHTKPVAIIDYPMQLFGPNYQSWEYTSLDSPPRSVDNVVRY